MEKKQARRESRILALETLFAYLAREEQVPLKDVFRHVLKDVLVRKEDEFAEKIVQAAVDNLKKIKIIIRSLAQEFAFDKIAPINRAILILGVTEIKFLETPPIVAINEYIEIAKDFGEEKSAGFINGVLDNFRKNLGLERTKEEGKD